MRMFSRETKSVTWQGQEFRADAEGFFQVPAEAVADLRTHGLDCVSQPVGVEAPVSLAPEIEPEAPRKRGRR